MANYFSLRPKQAFMNFFNLINLIEYLLFCVIFLPITVGLRYWKQLPSTDKWLNVFLILQVINFILFYFFYNKDIFDFIRYFSPLITIWCGTIFFREANNWRYWPIVLASLMSIAIHIEITLWLDIKYSIFFSSSFSYFLLMAYAFFSLKKQFDQSVVISLRSTPNFYQYIGFFIYGFTFSVSALATAYVIETSISMFIFIRVVEGIINVLVFGLFTIGMIQSYKLKVKSRLPLWEK